MMKRLLLVVTALFAIHSSSLAQDVLSRLIGASPFQDSLWVIDTTNSNVTHRFMAWPSSGGSLLGMNGIAINPNSGTIFTVSKQNGVTGRMLGKLNLNTSMVTLIGNLGDNFAAITFRGDSLFGVTGDGATVPESVYLIDTATAAKTLFRTLGNGADGEAISYNPTDDMIYHWSGNGTIVYEKFSPVNAGDPVINIPIIGTTNGEIFGSVYMGNNKFYNSNIGSAFNRWDANGTVDPQMGNSPDDIRGLAFVTCTREISGDDNYCVGDSTVLSVETALGYQWFKDGVELSGETSSVYSATAPGVYNCRIHDVCGTDSLSTGITVQENPLPNVNVSGTSTYCTGTPIALTGSSGGTSQWYLDGAPISGETSNTILVSAPGVYNMTKTNLNGCTDSAAVGITVVEFTPPTVTLDATAFAVCMNEGTVALTESPAGGTFTGSNGNQFDPSTATPGMDTVIYEYTDVNGCTSSDTIQIEVFTVPVVDLAPVANLCENDSPVTLNGTPVGGTFTGSNGNEFDPSLATTGVNTVIYEYTDTNSCTSSDTIQIEVFAAPSATIDATPSLCLNNAPVNLSGTPVGGTFFPSGTVDPAAVGVGVHNYTYIYTDTNGCSDTTGTTVTVQALPTVTAGSPDTDMCEYDGSVTLIGTPAGGTFSGPGVTGNSFDPSAANIGNNTINYFYTDGMTGCTDAGIVVISVDSCLAVNEALFAAIDVYPNPATTEVIVDLGKVSEDAVLTVLDMTGKRVNVSVTNEDKLARVSVAQLENGTYWLVITTTEGEFRQKVVVVH